MCWAQITTRQSSHAAGSSQMGGSPAGRVTVSVSEAGLDRVGIGECSLRHRDDGADGEKRGNGWNTAQRDTGGKNERAMRHQRAGKGRKVVLQASWSSWTCFPARNCTNGTTLA